MDDVKEQAELDTAATPSSSEETTQDQAPVETETADRESQAVPYSRFKEVNQRYQETQGTVQELQRKLQELESKVTPAQPVTPEIEQAKQALAQLGYKPESELRAEMQQMLAQERQNQRVEQQLTQLEKSYDGKDGRPKFDRTEVVNYALSKGFADPEAAYEAMHRKEIIDWHIKQAIAKSGGTKSEASDGTGSAQAAGTADSDLREAAMGGDKNALRLLLKRAAGFKS